MPWGWGEVFEPDTEEGSFILRMIRELCFTKEHTHNSRWQGKKRPQGRTKISVGREGESVSLPVGMVVDQGPAACPCAPCRVSPCPSPWFSGGNTETQEETSNERRSNHCPPPRRANTTTRLCPCLERTGEATTSCPWSGHMAHKWEHEPKAFRQACCLGAYTHCEKGPQRSEQVRDGNCIRELFLTGKK